MTKVKPQNNLTNVNAFAKQNTAYSTACKSPLVTDTIHKEEEEEEDDDDDEEDGDEGEEAAVVLFLVTVEF
jgi:hypothetical protein